LIGGVIVVAILLRRPGPESITKRVVEQFMQLSEQDIALAETQVKRQDGLHPEEHLLYALRVSRCIPNVTKLKTLASRWRVANCGAGGMGLLAGQSATNWQMVYNFLADLYQKRLDELCGQAFATTRESVSRPRSARANLKVIDTAIERIQSAQAEFTHDLPGLEMTIDKWVRELGGLAGEFHN
jgi:hypothetical protein